jgi:hypothetical protein
MSFIELPLLYYVQAARFQRNIMRGDFKKWMSRFLVKDESYVQMRGGWVNCWREEIFMNESLFS